MKIVINIFHFHSISQISSNMLIPQFPIAIVASTTASAICHSFRQKDSPSFCRWQKYGFFSFF
jgi:hypothetical protein